MEGTETMDEMTATEPVGTQGEGKGMEEDATGRMMEEMEEETEAMTETTQTPMVLDTDLQYQFPVKGQLLITP